MLHGVSWLLGPHQLTLSPCSESIIQPTLRAVVHLELRRQLFVWAPLPHFLCIFVRVLNVCDLWGELIFFYFFCIGFTRRNNTICRVACVCLLHVYDFPVDGRGFCCHFEQHVATTAWAPHKTIHEMCFNALSDINVQQEEPSVKLLATSVEFTQKDYRMLAYFYMDLFVYWLFKYLYYLTFCNSISSISMCHYCYHFLNLQLDFSICTIFFFAFLKCISYY